jgi:DNA-binding LytR/AlgR family response regulator
MNSTGMLRTLVVDDEQLARDELCFLLGQIDALEVVGQAGNGIEALRAIEEQGPDLVLLDVQMPGLTGFEVARRLVRAEVDTQVVFVTAYDQHAIEAFEVNAVDYLLKPVDKARLRETMNRAQERIEHSDIVEEQASRVGAAIEAYEASCRPPYLQRIPVRHREEVLIVPVHQIASIVAEGELLHITTIRNERHTINYRLKDLEQRLDPAQFIRLGRGTLANVELVSKVSVMPGGTHVAVLSTGHQLPVSRLQSRVLRERFLKL